MILTFSRALYEMAQVSIDEGNLEDAKNETDLLYGKIEEKRRRYLKGQICEMEEKFREAKEIYRKLIEEERAEKKNADQDFLHSVYERYFLIERSYWCSRDFSNTKSGKYVERSTGLRTTLDDARRDSRGL